MTLTRTIGCKLEPHLLFAAFLLFFFFLGPNAENGRRGEHPCLVGCIPMISGVLANASVAEKQMVVLGAASSLWAAILLLQFLPLH